MERPSAMVAIATALIVCDFDPGISIVPESSEAIEVSIKLNKFKFWLQI